jgi:hypothetical protein
MVSRTVMHPWVHWDCLRDSELFSPLKLLFLLRNVFWYPASCSCSALCRVRKQLNVIFCMLKDSWSYFFSRLKSLVLTSFTRLFFCFRTGDWTTHPVILLWVCFSERASHFCLVGLEPWHSYLHLLSIWAYRHTPSCPALKFPFLPFHICECSSLKFY